MTLKTVAMKNNDMNFATDMRIEMNLKSTELSVLFVILYDLRLSFLCRYSLM